MSSPNGEGFLPGVSETGLKPDQFIVKRKGVISRFVGDQAILVCPESRHPFRLNEAGARIWELMDHRHQIDDLIDSLGKYYHVERDDILPDVMAFVSELLEKRLLKKAS